MRARNLIRVLLVSNASAFGPACAAEQFMYAVDSARDMLLTIDLETGAMRDAGPVGFDGGLWGLAFSATPVPGPGGSTFAAGTLFGVEVSTQTLYTLDVGTGQASAIGPTFLLGVWESLTFDADGRLWTADVYDRFTLDTTTGTAVHAPGGLNVPGGYVYSTDMLRAPAPIPGGGALPAGTIIACRGRQVFAVDGASWHLLLSITMPLPLEVIASAPDGSIYGVAGPPGDMSLWRLTLEGGTELIADLGPVVIWGGAIIPAPSMLGALGLAGLSCIRRRRR